MQMKLIYLVGSLPTYKLGYSRIGCISEIRDPHTDGSVFKKNILNVMLSSN
jgi:hypothetical protein